VGGCRSQAAPLIVTSGLANEPVQDTTTGYLQVQITDIPGGSSWILMNVEIGVRIENARAVVRLAVVNSGTTKQAVEALRATSTPFTE
jgi:hypothetical protein